MASRPLRKSAALTAAEKRLAGISEISPTLDLGDGYTVAAYAAVIAALRDVLKQYNQDVTAANEGRLPLKAAEKLVSEYGVRFLDKVAGKFGRESQEFLAVG